MKISEMIECLERIKSEHGDLEVETYKFDGSRVAMNAPKIDYRAILKGRERRPQFASSYYGDDRKERFGEKVCRL
ncbi:hypothetical protein [Aromatoleum anaerobium]|uniref:DNA ligase n=1 Tax=Aromatoleum anaerobium TaxID=182180 RepID=A0ABX1PML3_9RHOO|nr:hypothetical protein [Aromatoleum anaerobium]MCK0507971.1 hypothetical protein [Aromatoleum anaerobium]